MTKNVISTVELAMTHKHKAYFISLFLFIFTSFSLNWELRKEYPLYYKFKEMISTKYLKTFLISQSKLFSIKEWYASINKIENKKISIWYWYSKKTNRIYGLSKSKMYHGQWLSEKPDFIMIKSKWTNQ